MLCKQRVKSCVILRARASYSLQTVSGYKPRQPPVQSMWDFHTLTRAQTCVPAVEVWICNPWTAGEVPKPPLLFLAMKVDWASVTCSQVLISQALFHCCILVHGWTEREAQELIKLRVREDSPQVE